MARGKASQKRKRQRKHQKRLQILRRYKALKGCAKCGEKDWQLLEFHAPMGHTGGKETTISRLVGHHQGWVRIKAEALKCIVLCHKHHIEIHQRWTGNAAQPLPYRGGE